MRRAFSFLLLSIPLSSCDVPRNETASPSDPFKCAGIEKCVEAVGELSRAEIALKLEYDGALERIRTCKPANSTRCYNLPRAIKLIEAEQQTWLAWRDTHCDVFTFGMEETSAEGELRAFCRTDETRKRTTQLKKIRND